MLSCVFCLAKEIKSEDLHPLVAAEEIRDRYDRNLEIGRQNVDLAERQWRQRDKEKEYEEALKDLELRYQLQSHLLNENDPEQFKGMSPEELAAIYRERRYQVDYRSRQKEVSSCFKTSLCAIIRHHFTP